ncbi:MAG: hypothetical protein QOI03_1013, partial [Solirubrobacteraceae bacterium]|nr:hypothetical protein [Solirubrobacteraceae bacterium]
MGAGWMSRSVAVIGAVLVWLGLLAGGALAASVSLCVPSASGQPVVSGACSGSGTTVALPASSADQQTLSSILPHISVSSSGVGGKPTIKFTGVNVQIIDGAGSTASVNGTGNLVLGYDESPGTQSGSHDLVLGRNQSFTGYSELVGGYGNNVSGNYASALGYSNKASGPYSLIGGDQNTVSGSASSVLGGLKNTVSSAYSTLAGGCSNLVGTGTVTVSSICTNTASYPHNFASITGGVGNQASGIDASVSGGHGNVASGQDGSWIGGGYLNTVSGQTSAISG